MVDDFFWEVMFVLDTVLFSIPKTSSVCVFNPGVLVEVISPPTPQLLPILMFYKYKILEAVPY